MVCAVLAMLAGAALFEPAEDAVEMGQAVEATRVADVGDGVLRLGDLLFCLGDAAGLDEPDEVGSRCLPEHVREVGGGQVSMLGGFRQCQRWIAEQGAAPYVPSFLVAGQYVYVIKDNGQLSCYDAVTGASVYEERLRGHFTASPWTCGDKLFFLNERGDTYVVQTGPTFRLLATHTLERLGLATPAVAGERLLILTSARLYCIGSK